MKEQLYIDRVDVYTEYGLYLTPAAMKTLVQWPKMKAMTSVEWAEYDGEQVDLSNPVIDSRQITLTFNVANIAKLSTLINILSDEAYHTFRFSVIDAREYTLRLISMTGIQTARRLGKITLTFADDTSEFLAGWINTQSESLPIQGVMIMDEGGEMIDVGRLGARVLQGTNDSFRRWGQVRENLKRNFINEAGIEYDGEIVRFRPLECTVKLLMHAEPQVFWNGYKRLFRLLTLPEKRVVYLAALNRAYACYYKQQIVQEFELGSDGRLWCKFDVTLRLPDWPAVATDYAIATEQSEQFTTTTINDSLIQPE